MRHLIIGLFLFGWILPLSSQQAKFHQKEGVFSSATAFQAGIPDMSWRSCCQDWYISPEDEYLRIGLKQRSAGSLIPLIVCVEGDCFLHDPELDQEGVAYYARLIDSGPIGLFRIRRTIMDDIPVKAYNPVNGRPFIQGTVQRPREWEALFLWDPSTGRKVVLDRFSFQDWTGYEAPESGKETDLVRGIRAYNQMYRSKEDPMND